MEKRRQFKDRLVFGILGDVGYIVKKPGHGKRIERTLQSDLKKRHNEAALAKELRNIANSEMVKEFWIQAANKSLKAQINRLVDLAVKGQQEIDTNEKRNRLKVMMLNEQSTLYKEYTDAALRRGDVEYEMKKERAKEIENQVANLQEVFVKSSMDRIFKNNCDDLRSKISHMTRLSVAEFQKMQMEEKRATRAMEEDEEVFWQNVAAQRGEMETFHMDQEAAKKVERTNDYFSALGKQVEEMERVKKNVHCLENWEERQREEFQEIQKNRFDARVELARRNRQNHHNELQNQIKMNRLAQLKVKEQDEAVGRLICEEDAKALRREQDAYTDDRERLRKELTLFQSSLGEYRETTRLDERETENEVYRQLASKENQRIDASNRAKLRIKNASIALVAEQKRQENEKRVALEIARQRDLVESNFERFRFVENVEPIGLNEMRDDARNCWSRRDARVNFENAKFVTLKKEREKIENEVISRRFQNEYESKLKELLNQPVRQFIAGSGVHPFQNLVSPSQSRT